MITLRADNRVLTTGAKYSYLADNYLSGVTSLSVISGSGLATNDYVLIGEWGSETSEIKQITVSGNTLTVSATSFAHPESTKITVIKYNQVKFYHTTSTTFSTGTQVGSTTDVQADDNFTKVYDSTYTTGYGWFVFYNETTTATSTNSNAIPYAGFEENSVKKIFDNFYSLLNNKEVKLITNSDAFSWLNEAYAIACNELNLVNPDYFVAAKDEIATVSGTQEYSLESNISEIISVYDADHDINIDPVDIGDVALSDYKYANITSGNTRYYLRGAATIGFSPVPTSVVNMEVRYKTKATKLDSLYDSVDLPNNNYYFLVDYMMFRAAPKLNRADGQFYYELFRAGTDRMKITSHKRDGEKESIGILDEANI